MRAATRQMASVVQPSRNLSRHPRNSTKRRRAKASEMFCACENSSHGSLLRRIPWFGGRVRLGRRLGWLCAIELCGAHYSLAFFHHDHLIGLHVLQGIDRSARPANVEQLDLLRSPDAEVYAQIILRNVATAAAYFVDLL